MRDKMDIFTTFILCNTIKVNQDMPGTDNCVTFSYFEPYEIAAHETESY